jgi:DNA-binding PadR family transcriptional regulator
LILGVVRAFQPVHGYDVRRELLRWHADEWANVAPGSIYHALKKLADEGLLAEVTTEQVGARPARTRYQVTDKGESEFEELLRRAWWDYKPPIDPFSTAFTFLYALPREEGIGALRNRARQLRLSCDGTRVRMINDFKSAEAPHVPELIELALQKAALEADWCDKVADRLEAGELRAADD